MDTGQNIDGVTECCVEAIRQRVERLASEAQYPACRAQVRVVQRTRQRCGLCYRHLSKPQTRFRLRQQALSENHANFCKSARIMRAAVPGIKVNCPPDCK